MRHWHPEPVPTWSAAKLREHLDGPQGVSTQLIDVRQPDEFEAGHIPGARSIPLATLRGRLHEIDPNWPVFVYCHVGARSVAAVAILLAAGFRHAVHVAGGLAAWQGHVVEGTLSADWAWFGPATTPEEILAQIWHLERAAHRFYRDAAALVEDGAVPTFQALAQEEAGHEALAEDLYRRIVGREPDVGAVPDAAREAPASGWPAALAGGSTDDGREVPLRESLGWAAAQGTQAILELALALEATALDRYSQLLEHTPDPGTRSALNAMVQAERGHLATVTAALRLHHEATLVRAPEPG